MAPLGQPAAAGIEEFETAFEDWVLALDARATMTDGFAGVSYEEYLRMHGQVEELSRSRSFGDGALLGVGGGAGGKYGGRSPGPPSFRRDRETLDLTPEMDAILADIRVQVTETPWTEAELANGLSPAVVQAKTQALRNTIAAVGKLGQGHRHVVTPLEIPQPPASMLELMDSQATQRAVHEARRARTAERGRRLLVQREAGWRAQERLNGAEVALIRLARSGRLPLDDLLEARDAARADLLSMPPAKVTAFDRHDDFLFERTLIAAHGREAAREKVAVLAEIRYDLASAWEAWRPAWLHILDRWTVWTPRLESSWDAGPPAEAGASPSQAALAAWEAQRRLGRAMLATVESEARTIDPKTAWAKRIDDRLRTIDCELERAVEDLRTRDEATPTAGETLTQHRRKLVAERRYEALCEAVAYASTDAQERP